VQLDFGPVVASAPFLARGLAMTLAVTAAAMLLGLALGLLVALLRLAPLAPARIAATLYVDFFRGLPQLVFLIWLYFGLSTALRLEISPLQAAIAALAIQESAYAAEIFRAALQAIPRRQLEAALSLGLSPAQGFRDVLLPQMLRLAIPAIGNDTVGMLKASSLVSVLGVYELMRVSQARANFFFRPFEFLTTAAVLYIVLAWAAGWAVARVERRFRWA
jgi:His/Glu/Gln/Arg/opine family amino acid ABC transporter permease subunit